MRFFNTTGPVVAEDHYCIPPLERLNLVEVRRLIRDKRYFVLHAPGKRARRLRYWPCAICSTKRMATVACTSMSKAGRRCEKMWNK